MTFPALTVALTMDDINYQVTGMIVVASCLIFLSLILTVSGTVAVKLEESRKAKAAAAKAAAEAAAAKAAATPVAAPAAATEMSPAEIAAMAAGIYNTAASSITPQLVAVIAAAVRVTLGGEPRILAIKPVDNSFARGGRSSIMNSHFPKKG
ncbi:MAG: OadG family transporter subunit [Akkermansia sp.]